MEFNMKPKSILLIEDEKDLLSSLEGTVRELAAQIFTATTAEHAMALLDEHPINLIIIDIDTIHEKGIIDFVNALHNRNRRLTIIVISAYGSPRSLREQALAAGAVGYIEKPFDPEDFNALVQQYLAPQGFNGVGVHGMNLFDLLQFIEMDNKSILLKVRNNHADEGKLYFDKGMLVHATMKEKAGKEACYEVMAWEEGNITSLQLPTEFPTTVFDPASFLMLEAMRIKDEQENDLTHVFENSAEHPTATKAVGCSADTSAKPEKKRVNRISEKTTADSAFTGTSVPSSFTLSKETIMTLQQIQEQFKSEIQGFISGVVVDTEQSLLLAGTSADPSFDTSVPVGFFNEVVRTTNSALDVTNWGMPEDILSICPKIT